MQGRETIHGILLAAGAASRFGGGKLLHRLDDGTPIGVAAWRRLRSVLPQTTVVLRPGDAGLQQVYADAGAKVVICEQAALGMGHSLACGVAASTDAAGWLVALADMPAVDPATMAAIADALVQGASIVVPTFDGRRGHPVGFAARHRAALVELSGDQGARSILERHAGEVARLSLNDPGILQDVDTRQDAEQLSRAR